MLSGEVDPALLQDASYLLQVAIAAYTVSTACTVSPEIARIRGRVLNLPARWR